MRRALGKLSAVGAFLLSLLALSSFHGAPPAQADGPCPALTSPFPSVYPITSAGLTCDSNGNLDVNVKVGGGGGSSNVTILGGTANATPVPVIFSSPQPFTLASIPPVTFATTQPIQIQNGANVAAVDANGTLASRVCDATVSTQCVTVASGAAASNLTYFGGVALGAATAAGTSASGNILSVQGVSGGVPQIVNITRSGGTTLLAGTLPVAYGTTNKTCSAAANCSVKSTPGVLGAIVITTVGTTGAVTCYDNTAGSGTVIGGVSATNGAILYYEQAFNVPANNTGIYCVSGASGPAFTVFYS